MPSRTEANGETTILHYLDLKPFGIEDLSSNDQLLAKRDIADFITEEVLRKLSQGDSPVEGEGRFKRVEQDYASEEKGGRRLSDLELEGDLKDSLIVRPEGDFIKFGHEGEEVPKADGHNQLSSKAKNWAREVGFPKRRYIPDSNQRFTSDIRRGIENIVNSFTNETVTASLSRREDQSDLFTSFDVDEIRPQINARSSATSSLFSDDVIEEILLQSTRNRL